MSTISVQRGGLYLVLQPMRQWSPERLYVRATTEHELGLMSVVGHNLSSYADFFNAWRRQDRVVQE